MSRLYLAFLGSVILFFSTVSWAVPANETASATQATQLSPEKIELAMKRFTRAPHPMASAEQRKLTQEMKAALLKDGWDAQVQKFKAITPNTQSERVGGKDKKAPPSKELEGENLIAISKGTDRCLVLIAGHYDTKVFNQFRFVGANDGGSSTALMQDLARVISEQRKLDTASKTGMNVNSGAALASTGRWLDCSVGLVFFDGEEAILPEWSDGERYLDIQDNIYGSRAFAKNLDPQFEGVLYKGMPIKAAFVIDMVGHQNQHLFVTNGSNPQLVQKFLAQKTSTKIAAVNIAIEDDHLPLAQLNVPFVHVIDWTNLNEWHKESDTLEIISMKNIADFGDMLFRFLKSKR